MVSNKENSQNQLRKTVKATKYKKIKIIPLQSELQVIGYHNVENLNRNASEDMLTA